jgi:hypothetical protein
MQAPSSPSQSQIRSYEECMVEVGSSKLQLISYNFYNKFVCIVNNLDPGATICRVSGSTRQEAVDLGLAQAEQKVGASLNAEVKPKPLPPNGITSNSCLVRIEYADEDKITKYTVDAFLDLSIQKRMELILSGCLTFISDEEEVVPKKPS